MKWRQFLSPVQSIDGPTAHKMISSMDGSALVLLDVRQPSEYDREHLAGSKLIPLPQLNARLKELNPEATIIVY